jgi:Flp pilus assembly protein CpaB
MDLFENKKQLIMIAAAVVIGIVASVMVAGFVSTRINEETQILADRYQQAQKQREQQYNEQMAGMNQKIAAMDQNYKKAIEESSRAADKRLADAVAAAKAAAAAESARKATEDAQKNPPKKPKPSLALRTPAGKRAITLKIESIGAVGGLINPGDYVDIIAHLNLPAEPVADKQKKVVTAMIFQRVQILAVNTNLDQMGEYDAQQKDAALKITFAVDPQEAGLLSFAEKNGKLEMALRGPNESKSVMLSSATWSTLAEYVLENSGADLKIPDSEWGEEAPVAEVETVDVVEAKPYIPVYRGGKE